MTADTVDKKDKKSVNTKLSAILTHRPLDKLQIELGKINTSIENVDNNSEYRDVL
jgi:hypothetical protein